MSAINQGMLDTDLLNDSGPYFVAVDAEPVKAGRFKRRVFTALTMVPGYGDRTGGINYVNRHDGASLGYMPRDDAFASALIGPAAVRRPLDFAGGYVGGNLVADPDQSGPVGINNSGAAQRAEGADSVTIPTSQEQAAAFASPLLGNFIARFRKR